MYILQCFLPQVYSDEGTLRKYIGSWRVREVDDNVRTTDTLCLPEGTQSVVIQVSPYAVLKEEMALSAAVSSVSVIPEMCTPPQIVSCKCGV